jgi:(p)ppGpp synthase/HD superfamily hydrolase
MPLSEKYDQALVYVAELHRYQVRKGSGLPYIAHLLSVSSRVLSAGGTEVQPLAACFTMRLRTNSLLVSLADKADNAEAILNDYRQLGDELWGRFTAHAKVPFGITGS